RDGLIADASTSAGQVEGETVEPQNPLGHLGHSALAASRQRRRKLEKKMIRSQAFHQDFHAPFGLFAGATRRRGTSMLHIQVKCVALRDHRPLAVKEAAFMKTLDFAKAPEPKSETLENTATYRAPRLVSLGTAVSLVQFNAIGSYLDNNAHRRRQASLRTMSHSTVARAFAVLG